METLYTMQKELHRQIKNSFADFNRKGAAQMSKIAARTRLSGLEHWYAQLEANHTQILILSVSQREHEYFKSHLSDQIIDDYFVRKGEFEQYIEDAEQLENERNAAETPPPAIAPLRQIMAVDHQSLPEVNLPKFTGLQSQWENLRDLFYSIVHRRTDLDDSIKYDYLRSSLTDEALDRMKSIHISAEHYETAWNCLLKHYDNPIRTVSNLILELSSVQPMTPEADSELLRIYTKISGSLESLKASNRTIEDLGNDLIAHSLVQQYTDSISLLVDDAHHWTDSADVLFWLKGHPSQWNFSVAHRCSEIPTAVPHAFWHHVKSQLSPSDVLSRKGPRFLTEDPSPGTREQDELNFSVISIISVSPHKIAVADADSYSPLVWDLIARYATLERRLKSRLLPTDYLFLEVATPIGIISASDLENASAFWMYFSQMTLLKAEHAMLLTRLNSGNATANLNPHVQYRLIRVGGRSTHQSSDDDVKHPVFSLHSLAPTYLLIKDTPLCTSHGVTPLILFTFRQQIGLLRARPEVGRIIRSQVQFARYTTFACTRLMGDFPFRFQKKREVGIRIPNRRKWLFRRRTPSIGYLALLKQEFTPAGKRPKGRIIPRTLAKMALLHVVTLVRQRNRIIRR